MPLCLCTSKQGNDGRFGAEIVLSLPISLLIDELIEALDAVPSVLLIGRVSGLD